MAACELPTAPPPRVTGRRQALCKMIIVQKSGMGIIRPAGGRPPCWGAFPAARLYPHACQTWEMPVIGFKIQDMLSMYEFEAGSKEPSRHFTAIGQAPRQNGQHMVIDLWDIGGSLERHKTALEENSELFSRICSQETFVAMHVNSSLTRDILGRIYAVRVMLSNPEENRALPRRPGLSAVRGGARV